MTGEHQHGLDLARERYRRLASAPPPGLYLPDASPAFVGQVATAASAGNFMTVSRGGIGGAETSGSSGSFSGYGDTVPVLNLGPGTPASGDWLLVRWVANRWVAQRKGAAASGGHTLSPCTCTGIPDTLYSHVATPGSPQYVFPATIIWQALPADIGTYILPDPGYYSTDTFTSSDGLTKFRYIFSCYQGAYQLSLAFTTDSGNGSYPGESLLCTFNPDLGSGSGNTCSPFSMHNGYEPGYSYSPQGITVDSTGPP